jgi:hypothetical protein
MSADVSRQEGMDLLNKLISESKKVEIFMISPSIGLTCSIRGIPHVGPDQRIWVADRREIGEPNVAFTPSLAVAAKYGDERMAKEFPPLADRFRDNFTSALLFSFRDGSIVALFELKETSK